MLDELQVECTACGQAGLERGSFNDHAIKLCPKTKISCSSADIGCRWKGSRNRLQEHLINCTFQPLQSAITPSIGKNHQLKNKLARKKVQIVQCESENEEINERVKEQDVQLINERLRIQQLEEHIKQQGTQLKRQQSKIEQFNKQMKKEDAQSRDFVNNAAGEKIDVTHRR
ncbi:unnamed protein product [Rotaria magnacalcarata]|uniref:TRAF-type domain-containing protein n=1 Tax=Rotaria magnacalcarata TaxID=392030 RepID=A0A816TGL3_9BILA|nr:unnamed protein product [Rotaria magnacalcarata]CAF1523920.1 unnamed protein product [Rotaria magnacalcarata]CAF2101017.1 unnamed protein product [Rotaria magnacalcarata]CAF3884726.1 unnamed protein product [Rotaria magnacalcarata]CAF3901636.1 unnamed protein product [Rotaria magnacalcarata]